MGPHRDIGKGQGNGAVDFSDLDLPYESGASFVHAYQMARLCAASYLPAKQIDAIADHVGWTVEHVGRERDFETQLYDTPFFSVAIFTGSESWWDWLWRNLDWRAARRGDYILKLGCLKELERVFEVIDQWLPRTKPLLIGGHSAGGEAALQLLILYRLLKASGAAVPTVHGTYLFAPERGVSYLTARRLNHELMADIYRFVAWGDPTNWLPPFLWRIAFWKSGGWPLMLTGEPGVLLQVPEAIPAWRPISNHHIQLSYCEGLRRMCGDKCSVEGDR